MDSRSPSSNPLDAQQQEVALMLGVIQTSNRTLSGLSDMLQTDADLVSRRTTDIGSRIAEGLHFILKFTSSPTDCEAYNLRTVSHHDYATPSNVKDAAEGKSFTFIAIVVRDGMGTLFVAPGLRVKFLPKAKVSPYLAIGGGYAAYQQSKLQLTGTPDSLSRTVSRGAFDYGGVVDIPVWRWLGLRGEIRDFYTGNPNLNVRLAASG